MDYKSIPSITQKLWLAAYRFAKGCVEMEESDPDDGTIQVLCPASGQNLSKIRGVKDQKLEDLRSVFRFFKYLHGFLQE